MIIGKIFKPMIGFCVNHSNAILTGVSVTGVVTTAVLAAKEAPIARDRLDDLYSKQDGEPAFGEKIKTVMPVYIPAIGCGVVTIGAIIGNSKINATRNAVLASALTAAEKGFTEYQDKVVEMIGKEKEGKVRQAVSESKIPQGENPKIVFTPTGTGNYPCYDKAHDRYFYSSVNAIDEAVNYVNGEIEGSWDHFCRMNAFYEYLNLPPVMGGNALGWHHDCKLKIYHGEGCYMGIPGVGDPCFIVEFENRPVLYDPKRDEYLHICEH